MKALIDEIEGSIWEDLSAYGWATRAWGVLAHMAGFNRKVAVERACST